MALPPPRLYHPSTDSHVLPHLAQIHAACIDNDHQLATFLPPLSQTKMLEYWTDVASNVEKGRTAIFLQFADSSENEVIGYVFLLMPVSETGPFRGEVCKLMVSPNHRYKGVARRVMGLLEAYAREKERWLLVCANPREI